MKKIIYFLILILNINCTSLDELTLTSPEEEIITIDSLKILVIGNSFSEDAVEKYLHPIANSANKKIYIGNLYIPAGSLENHWNNMSNGKAIYRYFTWDFEGNKKVITNYNLNNALLEQDWDYISLQQVSQNSGKQASFDPYINFLIEDIKLKTKPNQKFILHQTWAYAQNSTHSGFRSYNNNQVLMYNSIVNTYNYWLNQNENISFVIPAGTAIQNARNTSIGDNLTRDGYHLNNKGKLLAAYTWFEKLYQIPATDNKFVTEDVSETENIVIKKCAHASVLNPDTITLF